MSRYFDCLNNIASMHPDREAICDGTRSISYGELAERVEQDARSLRAAGIGPSSSVGLTLADEFENIIATLALLRTGAMQLLLASHDSIEIRAQLLLRIHGTHLLTTSAAESFKAIERIDWPPPSTSSEDLARPSGGLFLRTSGTTGDSNLVPLSGDDLAIQATRNPQYIAGRHLRLASVEHNNSRRHRLYTLCMGGTAVLRPAVLRDVAGFCRQMSVTHMDVSMMHAVDLADSATDLPSLELTVGGSATPLDVRGRILELVSKKLHVRYGTTETGTIAVCPPKEHDFDEPVGRPVNGVDVEVVDATGVQVPCGQIGHIRVRAAGSAKEYFENGPQTVERFRDGWFWPGDLGVLRSDGVLVVKGRADDMIILNGINIFPAEIERVLQQHPAVAIAAAAGLPSPAHGHIPVAAVELLADGYVDERTLLGFAREHLGLRAPRRIKVVAALPRNDQGKLLRRQIPALFVPASSPQGLQHD